MDLQTEKGTEISMEETKKEDKNICGWLHAIYLLFYTFAVVYIQFRSSRMPKNKPFFNFIATGYEFNQKCSCNYIKECITYYITTFRTS